MDLSAIANVAFAGIAAFGAILGALALLAWRRSPSPRMALVAAGFLLIAVQGVVVGVGLFTGGLAPDQLLALSAGFEAALLVVLFVATLVR
jgi:ABC-type Fe3+ transport system permease subunit